VSYKLSKNQVTTYRKLAQRKYRDKFRLYLAEGLRVVSQLIEGGRVEIEAIIITDEQLMDELHPGNVPVLVADPIDFKSLSDTQQSQGIIAVCRKDADASIEQLFALDSGVIVALDRLQDPGNLGTIIRSATWFGASALILGSGSVDYYNPKVVRSTAGSIDILPHFEADLVPTLRNFEANGWKICALDVGSGAKDIKSTDFDTKTIIIVGNEGSGLSEDIVKEDYDRVFIRGHQDQVESLNAGVAVSICLYQFQVAKILH
jgi:RNA methyltransferase, TrmH family